METQPKETPQIQEKNKPTIFKVLEILVMPLLLLGPLTVVGFTVANETQGDHTYTNCVVSNPDTSVGWDSETPIKTSCGTVTPSLRTIFENHPDVNAQMSRALYSGKPVTIKATDVFGNLVAYEITPTDQ